MRKRNSIREDIFGIMIVFWEYLNLIGYYRRLFLSLIVIMLFCDLEAKQIIYDSPKESIEALFITKNTKYIIRYKHISNQTIKIPEGCEIYFEGGSIKGSLEFNNTLLSGRVRLQGSKLKGLVKNRCFRSEWICYKDGIHDDANNINQIIDICGKVYFQGGNYLLESIHSGPKIEKVLDEWQAEAHICISKSNVELIGEEKGVVFITNRPCGTICIFSSPYQFDKTIRNIKIENITFKSINNGKDFWQLKHTIRAIGVNGLVIKKCFFDDFWGDAICLHSYGDTPSTGERTRNSNILIEDNHIKGGIHHNNRNGISVVNGVNVKIINNHIEHTSRKDMPGAIDVEANSNAFSINNILIKENYINDCRGTAGGICINSGQKLAPAHYIKIEGNYIRGCTSGLAFVVITEHTTSNFTVIKNIVENDTKPFQFIGSGKSSNWTFKDNIFKQSTSTKLLGDIHVSNLVSRGNIINYK